MDYQVTQQTRSLLQTRVRRVKGCEFAQYGEQLKFLFHFIDESLVFSAASETLVQKQELTEQQFREIFDRRNPYDFTSENQYLIFAYYLLREIVSKSMSKDYHPTLLVAATLLNGGDEVYKHDEAINLINDYALDPFYEYLDESVDNRNATLLLLHKYKHRCEWFWVKRLNEIAEDSALYWKKGERGLMYDMYEYLHLQGLDFHIEPQSASGEVDLIANQSDEARIVLDGKYVGAGESDSDVRKKIISGFRQVYSYCCDFNVRVGYLVVYNALGKGIDIESMVSDGFDYCNINGKAIYFLNIDIHDYEKSASKRGQLGIVSIPAEKLVDEN